MIYYISDLHFGHANVIQFDHRPFDNVDQMDKRLIELWNEKVCQEDAVYIAGDFANRNSRAAQWYLERLNGRKYLVLGNHDEALLKNRRAMDLFEDVDKMMYVVDEGRHICICHFPICEWKGYRKGYFHIYGHLHNRRNDTYQIMRTRKRAYNAGCMLNHYTPVSLEELIRNNEEFWRAEER